MTLPETLTPADYVRDTVRAYTLLSPTTENRTTRRNARSRITGFCRTDATQSFMLAMTATETFQVPRTSWFGRILDKMVPSKEPVTRYDIVYADFQQPQQGRRISATAGSNEVLVDAGDIPSPTSEVRDFCPEDAEIVDNAIHLLIERGAYED